MVLIVQEVEILHLIGTLHWDGNLELRKVGVYIKSRGLGGYIGYNFHNRGPKDWWSAWKIIYGKGREITIFFK